MIDLADLLLEPEPHPELVAVQRPTSAQMTEAVMEIGFFPPRRFFWPAVPAEG